jgi:hypothetical protein
VLDRERVCECVSVCVLYVCAYCIEMYLFDAASRVSRVVIVVIELVCVGSQLEDQLIQDLQTFGCCAQSITSRGAPGLQEAIAL